MPQLLVPLALASLAVSAAAQCEIQPLIASDHSSGDQLGAAVSVRGNDAVFGAPGVSAGRGAAYVFERTGKDWSEVIKLGAGDPNQGANFGHSVSLFSDRVLVGAPKHGGQGAAYVFDNVGGVWTQSAKLAAADIQPGDRFGESVSLFADVAVVGALNAGPGAAYVFELVGGVWTEVDKLTGSGRFGASVSVSGDLLLVGELGSSATSTGRAVLFRREASGWTQLQAIASPDALPGDAFGASVEIDPPYALVGAPGIPTELGAAYVFEEDLGLWSFMQKLDASDSADSNAFGTSVSMIGAGTQPAALVGDPQSGAYGAAYLYKLEEEWTQKARHSVDLTSEFGSAVSLSGGSAIVGARLHGAGGFLANEGRGFAFTLVPQGISEVEGIPATLSNASGGFQFLFFDTCVGQAGNAYLLYGSASGTSPGTTVGGLPMPLNPDTYYDQVLAGEVPSLFQTAGIIRPTGSAEAIFFLEPGTLPVALTGVTVHHAFLVFDLFTSEALLVSDAIPLTLTP
ncbi:MAG: hypothetical protein AAF682_00500 [Planctomycetota bacterium]